jgi:hypothetical protein
MHFGSQVKNTMQVSAIPLVLLGTLGSLWCTAAMAYIGPGAGVTVLGALWGVIVAIVLTLGAVVLWPFRILLRRRRTGAAKAVAETAPESKKST